MRFIPRFCLLFVVIVTIGASYGCMTPGAYSRGGAGGQTNFLDFGADMAGSSIIINQGGKTIFVRGGDITGHGINVPGCLIQILGQRYIIVSSPQEADYTVDVQVVQFNGGKNRENALAIGTEVGSAFGSASGFAMADSGSLSPAAASLAGLGVGLAAGLIAGAIVDAATPEFYGAAMNVVVQQRMPFFHQMPKGKKAKARPPEYVSGQCAYRAWVQVAPGGNGADVSAKLSQLLANAAAGIF